MNEQEFDDLADRIFSIDKKIRFVGIVDNKVSHYKMKQGTTSYLTKEETEEALADAMKRWEIRKKYVSKLGDPFYAMAMYEKTKRFTLPIKDGLVCISTEIDIDNDDMISRALNEIQKHFHS
ncbi:MAG: hypothetical protein RI100_02705 [Nitrosarchaeum sp.]|uniref:hypothetical protein n=1 Tax=Nitrosarchaeum sp. TaxID=2026886 RepID=UPI002DF3B72A|nr:hypothetical protein [Nitrosarchaeum sp.]